MPKSFGAAVLAFAAVAVEAQMQTYLPNTAAHYSFAEHQVYAPSYYEVHNAIPLFENGNLYSLG